MPGKLLVGTSGFSYDHWREAFYGKGVPQNRWLEAYSETFSSVELNVSFYRLPARKTFEHWCGVTPATFAFSIKGTRTITHYRRLQDVDDQLTALMQAAAGLSEKLACILWQLPPRFAPDTAVLDAFCRLAAERAGELLAAPVRHAFEFRDERWYHEEVLDVLRSHGCALVLADPPPDKQPVTLTAEFAYLRFHHGPRESGAYEAAELGTWVRRCRGWLDERHDVLAYFNNDPGAWAPKNAQSFRALIEGS